MKRVLLFYCLISTALAVSAQETNSTPDQNPNFKTSLDKYKLQQDGLLATMNTTVQNTYKAYDWYEAKQERKQQKTADRRERRLYELQNYGNYYNPYNNYYDPFATPYRYSRYRSNNRGWRHW
ncbi:MAG: hypothetical protein H7320_02625 [Ferruginibacter sp.]|nr:hypothetical protein [Ferruginibacter sp.]